MTRTIVIFSLMMLFGQSAWAEIDAHSGTLAVLGEAGQGYDERLAIAFALKNRGHLKGVYGYKVALKRSYSGQDYQNASRAFQTAVDAMPGDDITRGATHWLSDYDLAHCKPSLTAFRHSMTETAYIGTTHFYKER